MKPLRPLAIAALLYSALWLTEIFLMLAKMALGATD